MRPRNPEARPRATRPARSAIEEPELKLPRAVALVDYNVRRNEVARRPRAKTWWAKYEGVRFLRLQK